MSKNYLYIVLLFFNFSIFSQSNWKKFKELSPPMRMWVILHPFKANKASEISEKTQQVADSIKKTSLLDGDASGGQVDAFRHAFWMASLRQEIGRNAARSLGKSHEKENYRTYKKRKLEDGLVPDKIATTMDLFNNNLGLSLTKKGGKISTNSLIYRVINEIYFGKLKVIKKDSDGNFLTCNNKPISQKYLKGKWKNNKCLVNSNYKR